MLDVKQFPLIIDFGHNEFLIPPNTLKLIANYLSARDLEKEKIDELRSLEGYKFEVITADKLEKIGINVDYVNYKDDPKNPTFEIDIIAHHNNTIFVIDCKSWLLTTGYLFKKARYRREKEMKEQVEKQEKRVNFIKNNLKLLGYDEKSITGIKSILITKLNEDIDKIDGSHIIPFDKIDKLLDMKNKLE